MVWRVIKYLILDTGELQNFRNYRIIRDGYCNLKYTTDNNGTNSYSGWDLGVVEFAAAELDTMHVEKSLLLY